MVLEMTSACLYVGLVSESHSLLIRGWWSFLPITSAILTLDSVPIFKFLCIPVRDGYGPLLSPPPRFTRVLFPPGHLSCILSPFFLFDSSPSISVYSAAHLQQCLVFHRPSVGKLPTLWLQRPTNVLSWFPVQRPICRLAPPLTCATGGTWLGCEWGGKGDGAPLGGLESVVSLAGITS